MKLRLKTGRIARLDIEYLLTARFNIALAPGQEFYETRAAYEIWQIQPLAFIKRIPKTRVLWVVTKD